MNIGKSLRVVKVESLELTKSQEQPASSPREAQDEELLVVTKTNSSEQPNRS